MEVITKYFFNQNSFSPEEITFIRKNRFEISQFELAYWTGATLSEIQEYESGESLIPQSFSRIMDLLYIGRRKFGTNAIPKSPEGLSHFQKRANLDLTEFSEFLGYTSDEVNSWVEGNADIPIRVSKIISLIENDEILLKKTFPNLFGSKEFIGSKTLLISELTPKFVLIQGPSGVGKSVIMRELAVHFLSKKKRILWYDDFFEDHEISRAYAKHFESIESFKRDFKEIAPDVVLVDEPVFNETNPHDIYKHVRKHDSKLYYAFQNIV